MDLELSDPVFVHPRSKPEAIRGNPRQSEGNQKAIRRRSEAIRGNQRQSERQSEAITEAIRGNP